MNESLSEYTPLYRFEFEQLYHRYNQELEELFGGPVDYRMIPVQKDFQAQEQNRAIRIRAKNSEPRDITAVCCTDHDDTIEPYSIRKKSFIQGVLRDENITENQEQVSGMLKILNKAARIRPINGAGPERYSPLLEMTADSVLLEMLKAHDLENIETFLADPSEENARQFILTQVVPKFFGMVDTFTENEKLYFREAKHQALAVSWKEKPSLVSKSVWNNFVEFMTKPTIPESELEGLNLDPQIYWIVSTFGEVGFQTEKVINALKLIKAKVGRIPDEILIFTRGRKEPVVSSIIEDFPPEVMVIALDDSVSQLEMYASNSRIIPIRAVREGSKRGNGVTPDNIQTIAMEHGDLNEQLMKVISKN